MKLTCLIIDDEPDAHSLLEYYCKKTGLIEVVGNYSDAFLALQHIERETVNFIFLDINMPEMSGFEMLNLIKKPIKVIFTTAHSEFSLESYEHNTIDYLLKPIKFERFVKAINKIKLIGGGDEYLSGKVEFKNLGKALDPKEIIYAEAYGNYVKLYVRNIFFVVHETMKNIENILTPYGFIRCHKSYLFNKEKLHSCDKNNCLLINNINIPVGISYRQQVKSFLDSNSHT